MSAFFNIELSDDFRLFSSLRWIQRLNEMPAQNSPANESNSTSLKSDEKLELLVTCGGGTCWVFIHSPLKQPPVSHQIHINHFLKTSFNKKGDRFLILKTYQTDQAVFITSVINFGQLIGHYQQKQ